MQYIYMYTFSFLQHVAWSSSPCTTARPYAGQGRGQLKFGVCSTNSCTWRCMRGPQNEQRSVDIKIVDDHKNPDQGSQANEMIKPSIWP